ncbi:MAG: hypothetical protein WCJ37_12430 [Syntrophus sp. (in: bacteria)]
MSDFERLKAGDVIVELGRRFREPARDRRIYAVSGTYAQLESFVPRIRELCDKNALCDQSNKVTLFNLNEELLGYLEEQGKMDQAMNLADRLRNKELIRLMEDTWKSWLSTHIKEGLGLILTGFELFFSYLDSNALALVRQYAINGKHIGLILPGAERDGHVWAFDETPEFRRQVTGLVSEWTYILKQEE